MKRVKGLKKQRSYVLPASTLFTAFTYPVCGAIGVRQRYDRTIPETQTWDAGRDPSAKIPGVPATAASRSGLTQRVLEPSLSSRITYWSLRLGVRQPEKIPLREEPTLMATPSGSGTFPGVVAFALEPAGGEPSVLAGEERLRAVGLRAVNGLVPRHHPPHIAS